jgi:hypothetical protein
VTDDPPPPTHEPCGNGHQKPVGQACDLCSNDAARWTPDRAEEDG